jgi:hypothetical protein
MCQLPVSDPKSSAVVPVDLGAVPTLLRAARVAREVVESEHGGIADKLDLRVDKLVVDERHPTLEPAVVRGQVSDAVNAPLGVGVEVDDVRSADVQEAPRIALAPADESEVFHVDDLPGDLFGVGR